MPLTSKGEEIMSAMKREYGGDKGKEVFYASKNKGTISGVDRADELSPLADRIDALNQRADTIADRHFEAARQDAVRSARADITAVAYTEPGRQRPREAGRFMPRGDKDEGVNMRQMPRRDGEGEHNRQQPRRDDEMGRPDTELNLAKYASPAQNSAFPESPINRGRNAVES